MDFDEQTPLEERYTRLFKHIHEVHRQLLIADIMQKVL